MEKIQENNDISKKEETLYYNVNWNIHPDVSPISRRILQAKMKEFETYRDFIECNEIIGDTVDIDLSWLFQNYNDPQLADKDFECMFEMAFLDYDLFKDTNQKSPQESNFLMIMCHLWIHSHGRKSKESIQDAYFLLMGIFFYDYKPKDLVSKSISNIFIEGKDCESTISQKSIKELQKLQIYSWQCMEKVKVGVGLEREKLLPLAIQLNPECQLEQLWYNIIEAICPAIACPYITDEWLLNPTLYEKATNAMSLSLVPYSKEISQFKYSSPQKTPIILAEQTLKTGDQVFCTMKEYEERMDIIAQRLGFSNIKSMEFPDRMIIAGGAALYCICKPMKEPKDIDIFIMRADRSGWGDTKFHIQEMIKKIQSANPNSTIVFSENNIVTLVNLQTKFQIQWIIYHQLNPIQLLKDFDFDYCQCCILPKNFHTGSSLKETKQQDDNQKNNNDAEIVSNYSVYLTNDAFFAIRSMCCFHSFLVPQFHRIEKAIKKGFSISAISEKFANALLKTCILYNNERNPTSDSKKDENNNNSNNNNNNADDEIKIPKRKITNENGNGKRIKRTIAHSYFSEEQEEEREKILKDSERKDKEDETRNFYKNFYRNFDFYLLSENGKRTRKGNDTIVWLQTEKDIELFLSVRCKEGGLDDKQICKIFTITPMISEATELCDFALRNEKENFWNNTTMKNVKSLSWIKEFKMLYAKGEFSAKAESNIVNIGLLSDYQFEWYFAKKVIWIMRDPALLKHCVDVTKNKKEGNDATFEMPSYSGFVISGNIKSSEHENFRKKGLPMLTLNERFSKSGKKMPSTFHWKEPKLTKKSFSILYDSKTKWDDISESWKNVVINDSIGKHFDETTRKCLLLTHRSSFWDKRRREFYFPNLEKSALGLSLLSRCDSFYCPFLFEESFGNITKNRQLCIDTIAFVESRKD